MKAHIIFRDMPGEDDRVLPRMAGLLAAGLGCTIGSTPAPDTQLIYGLPYLDSRGKTIPAGAKYAAYFTHREDILPAKVAIWESEAKRADLRIVTAQQYADALSEYGPTKLIRPPLDREHFKIAPREQNVRLRAGVSGFTYSGGRKGEELLARAIRTNAGQRFEWTAVGRGWPVETSRLTYGELPDWYASLDIYVCPSLIEGVPYGPLEALACGVPIVIPRGVGLLDELPTMPGIFRYDAGDLHGLADALWLASENIAGLDREALRAVTEPFTAEAWIDGHREAFAELGIEPSESLKRADEARMSQRGVYVVAYGDPARDCARKLIDNVHEFMPGVPVAVASDTPLPEADVNVYHFDADAGGRTAKTKMYELAPREWEHVLYLDADIEVAADISFIFEALADGWEMVCTKDIDSVVEDGKVIGYDEIWSLFRRDEEEHRLGWEALGHDRALQLAGGVIGFRRCEAMHRFLTGWYDEWYRMGRRDQGALIRNYFAQPVKLLVLGNEWNSFTGHFKGESAGVIHHRGGPARRVKRWGAGRMDRPQRPQKSGFNYDRGVAGVIGERRRNVRLSGRMVSVTYHGASQNRHARGHDRRVYAFRKGVALQVAIEDLDAFVQDTSIWEVDMNCPICGATDGGCGGSEAHEIKVSGFVEGNSKPAMPKQITRRGRAGYIDRSVKERKTEQVAVGQ